MRTFVIVSAILMFGLSLAAAFTGCKGNQFLPQPNYDVTNTPTITPTLPPGAGGWTFDTNLSDTVHPGINTAIWSFVYNPNSLINSSSWDGSMGDPNPGSVKLVLGFTNFNQKVEFGLQTNNPPSLQTNLSGKMCHVKYYIDSASSKDTSYLDQIKIYIKDGSSGWQWYSNAADIPTTPGWNHVKLDMAPLSGSTTITTDVNEIGVEITTTNGGSVLCSPVTMHIDSWVWE
jgi:hypothetical protein